MFCKKIKRKNVILYVILCTVMTAKAASVYTHFVFVNKSSMYTFKVTPGHSQCIDPDHNDQKQTIIYPNDHPSSYWTNNINTPCLLSKTAFVTWDLSIHNATQQLCSAKIKFIFWWQRRPYIFWWLSDYHKKLWTQHYNVMLKGKTTICNAIHVDNPYEYDKKALGYKNKITMTLSI